MAASCSATPGILLFAIRIAAAILHTLVNYLNIYYTFIIRQLSIATQLYKLRACPILNTELTRLTFYNRGFVTEIVVPPLAIIRKTTQRTSQPLQFPHA